MTDDLQTVSETGKELFAQFNIRFQQLEIGLSVNFKIRQLSCKSVMSEDSFEA